MTALPPTTGHLDLIRFAATLAEEGVAVVSTQPEEPMGRDRFWAVCCAMERIGLDSGWNVRWRHGSVAQDPESPGFWDMWRDILTDVGMQPGDLIVASEPYGQKLAEVMGGKFFPYDIDRSINPAKATQVRDDPFFHFYDILPEFQNHLRTTVTIFGAESTGKSMLSDYLAANLGGHWLFEYARPFLENTANEITVESMTGIWKGQSALQRHGRDNLIDKPYIIQDTDLFSTVGYWQFRHWQPKIGAPPHELVEEALTLKSELYIITPSNIPFEEDPLRYGGTEREGSDAYWIAVCEDYGLPYVVLESADFNERLAEAMDLIKAIGQKKAKLIAYDRGGF